MNKKLFNKGEDQQHFGLRKLTVGVASVLLGTTFMIYGGRTVQADSQNPSSNPQVTEVSKDDAKADSAQQEANDAKNKADVVNNNQANVTNETSEKAAEVSKSNDVKATAPKDAEVKENNLKINNNQKVPAVNLKEQKSVSDPTINIPDNLPLADAETRAKYMAASNLNKADLSDAQLASLGIDRDTYIKDGVKYKAVATAVVQTDNGYVNLGKVPAFHKANGELDLDYYHQIDNYINDDANFDTTADLGIIGVNYLPSYAPYLTGKTIYINKGQELTGDDARRALPSEYEGSYKDVAWDKQIESQVDINTPGSYDTAIDVIYDNQLGVSADTKVIVVDLSGKDEYTHVGADIPTAENSVNGAPAGSKATWTEEPSTAKAGDSTGTIEVTYPDNNKGTTQATLHVIAPEVKHEVDVWQGDPVPDAVTVITNTTDISNHIPGNTTYTWGTPVDTTVVGSHGTTVVTHWPDGKTTTSQTTIVVKNPNQPITDGEGTTEEVSRDIYTQIKGEDKKFDHTQKVTLHRTGNKNLKTGEITWNAWQSQEMPAVQAPAIKNYVVTNPEAGVAVTADGSTTKLADVVFQYTPAEETITTGDGTSMEVTRDIYTKVEGKAAVKHDTQKVTLHRTGVKNVVTGKITWGNWESQTVQAYPAPSIPNYTVENPGEGYAVIADGSTTKLRDVVFTYKANHQTITDGDGTTMEVSRDIYTQLEGQDKKFDHTQKVTLHRTGDKNMATGEIKWNNWESAVMPKVDAKPIPGYDIANPYEGRAVGLDGSRSKLDDVVFNYLAQDHKQVINYVDSNDVTKVVSSNTINGKTNTSVHFTPVAPENWEIVENQNIPTEITFGTTDNQPINILVKHGQKFDAKGDSKVVTRTVQYVDPETNETKLIKKQDVTLTRSTTTDLVTNQVTYGEWNTGVFKQVNAPELEGYKVINGQDGQAEVVNGNTQNETVTFRYSADMFNQVINYVDKDSNKVISSTNVAGQTNSTVVFDANSYIPGGYQLAKGQESNVTIKFGKTNPTSPVTIYVVAKTEPITAGTTKQVKRNIYVNLGDGSKNTLWTVQNVTLHRSAERNVITGEVTYGDWSEADMSAYAAPEIKNYTVTNPDAAAAVHVTGSTQDMNVTFNYKANHEKVTDGVGTHREVKRQINVKLGDNAVQKYTEQTITLTRTGDKNVATGEITWGAWSSDTMPAFKAPEFPAYTVTNPEAGAAVKIGESDVLNAVTFVYKANTKEITTGEGTEKTVSRDIYTKLDNAEPTKAATETVTLHRTGTQNLATGEITWNAWQEGEMPAYVAPEIKNYTVTNPEAGAAVKVDGSRDTIDRVVFNYTSNHETVTTGEGTEKTVTRDIYTKLEGHEGSNKVGTQTVTLHRTGDKNLATGKITWGEWSTGAMNAYTAPMITNYTVTNPDAAPAVTVTSSTKNMNVVFNYKANHETITTGDGTHMEVTRDIYADVEGQGRQHLGRQTVTLHRTGDKNLATGQITWGEWSSENMKSYSAPQIGGYTVTNPDAAPAVTVTSSTQNMNVVFNYKANDQSVNVKYVDKDTNNVVTTVPVSGKTGQTVSFDAKAHVPTGWEMVEGQNVPSSFTFGLTPISDKTIYIHHKENDRFKVSVPAGEKVTTHVGATANVPSLSASGIKLTWTENGKEVAAPADAVVTWKQVPDTTKITSETGTLNIAFGDGTSTTVDIPVDVQGAVAGEIQTVDQNAAAPEAVTTVNTSSVDHFGITNVEWSKTPSTATPAANVPGVARVHYQDGTYQDVNVAIDVRKVENGKNHRDDRSIFRSTYVNQIATDQYGNKSIQRVNKIHYRIRYTDYKYPVGDPKRVTYSAWMTDIEA